MNTPSRTNKNFKYHYWDPHYTLSANPDPTKAQNNKRYTCSFCNATFSGSAGRARSHIAGRAEPGKHKEVKDCPNPDPEIQRKVLEEYAEREQDLDAKKRKLEEGDEGFGRLIGSSGLPIYSVPSLSNFDRAVLEQMSSDSEPEQPKAGSSNKRNRSRISNISSLQRSRQTPSVSLQDVRDYYGKVLKKTDDLKTNACLTSERPPLFLQNALSKIHDSVLDKYYGCGLIAPEKLTGLRVLDLGCGSGRDCYVLSQLVGENGSVVGVDMTAEQLAPALSTVEHHRAAFGYKKSNTTFLTGLIERLDEIPSLEKGSFDVIVSNCVVNLSPDKESVLRQAYDMLKPGGEMYFSDIYSTQRLSSTLRADPVLWGECLSGAMYWNDFLSLAKACGFTDPRLVKDNRVTAKAEIEAKLGTAEFFSATYRLFKIAHLESDCENYGHTVTYKGDMKEHFVSTAGGVKGGGEGDKTIEPFVLDAHHSFDTGREYAVCGNTYRMLNETRFAPHFTFTGSFDDQHLGIFPGCGKSVPFASSGSEKCGTGGSSSCC